MIVLVCFLGCLLLAPMFNSMIMGKWSLPHASSRTVQCSMRAVFAGVRVISMMDSLWLAIVGYLVGLVGSFAIVTSACSIIS
uniref:Uncharacterized protein n=1 Tax=Ixodes ricinus TaxID=34613 RepID=A0A6B0U909_IXORI